MLFNSWEFFVFFPIVLFLVAILDAKVRWLILLLASCAFYMSFVPHYILILGATVVVDFYAAQKIFETTGRQKKIWLWGTIIFTAGILFVFKYFNFFIDNVNELLRIASSDYLLTGLSIILPIGLSFHTFQSLSYVIEVFRGKQKPESHFGIFSLYVLFFPQLVAGPIERPQNMLPQFNSSKPIKAENLSIGAKLVLRGLIKKVLIADNLAIFVNAAYESPEGLSGGILLIATFFFAMQVYCDFSGYSDIARGLAKSLGYDLMINFKYPYLASSLSEFWKRWHISLSSWLRDYVFTPLAVNWRDAGVRGIVFATLVTFGLSGLWHGASWTFLVWGLLHGLGLTVEVLYLKYIPKISLKNDQVRNFFGTALTFSFVCFTYVFFRSENLGDAEIILKNIGYFVLFFDFTNAQLCSDFLNQVVNFVAPGHFVTCCWLAIGLVLVETLDEKFGLIKLFSKTNKEFRIFFYAISVLLLVVYGQWLGSQSFIYFQF